MFASLNIMRYDVIEKLNLETFNYFLGAILETLDEPLNGRLVCYLLVWPLNDGGQWHMFCNLVKKYGVALKDAMPEPVSFSRRRENYYLTTKLKEFVCRLRHGTMFQEVLKIMILNQWSFILGIQWVLLQIKATFERSLEIEYCFIGAGDAG